MGRDGSLIFAEKPRFERKRAKLTLDAASRFLFLGSREDICRVPVCVRSRTGRYGVHIKPVIGPSRGGQARGPGSGSPRAEPGAPTSSHFDFAALRSGRPLEDFPSLGTPSRARAHGQSPWPKSRGRNNRYRARYMWAALWLAGEEVGGINAFD